MIPKTITRELEKLVRERDRYKLLAQDRAPVRSADGKRAIEGRDKAVKDLLFLVNVEGIGSLSRGGKDCIFRAVEALRPDVAAIWRDSDDPRMTRKRFFPEPDDDT